MDSDINKQIELSQDSLNETSSGEKKCVNDMVPDIVESIGCELKDTLTEWSKVLRQCKNVEDDTLGQLENMLKQAYLLEAECLKQRLNAVTKMIEK